MRATITSARRRTTIGVGLLTELTLSISLLAIVVIAVWCSFHDLYRFELLAREEGLVENGTAIMLLLAAFVLLTRVFVYRQYKGGRWRLFTITFALLCVFGFGEELSWGQRIFDLPVGEYMLEHNMQKEINFHNLKFGNLKINDLIFSKLLVVVVLLYFVALLPLYKRISWLERLITSFGIPLPRLQHTVLLFVSTLLVLFIPVSDKWEVWEFAFSIALLQVLINPYNEDRIYQTAGGQRVKAVY